MLTASNHTPVRPAKIDISLEYRNPTPSHCQVAVWINGGFAGELVLRQEEIITFQDVLARGISTRCGDTFVSRGRSVP